MGSIANRLEHMNPVPFREVADQLSTMILDFQNSLNVLDEKPGSVCLFCVRTQPEWLVQMSPLADLVTNCVLCSWLCLPSPDSFWSFSINESELILQWTPLTAQSPGLASVVSEYPGKLQDTLAVNRESNKTLKHLIYEQAFSHCASPSGRINVVSLVQSRKYLMFTAVPVSFLADWSQSSNRWLYKQIFRMKKGELIKWLQKGLPNCRA